MDYNLSRKNKEGKWWTYGRVRYNKWGNLRASFKVSSLKELVALAESEQAEWVDLSMFENKQDNAQQQHSFDKGNAFVKDDLDDEIPF